MLVESLLPLSTWPNLNGYQLNAMRLLIMASLPRKLAEKSRFCVWRSSQYAHLLAVVCKSGPRYQPASLLCLLQQVATGQKGHDYAENCKWMVKVRSRSS